jgi:cytochrome c-type biogenesis protein CcmE
MTPKTIVGVVLLAAFGFLVMRSFGMNVGGYMNFAEAEETGSHAHVIGNWLRDRPLGYDPNTNVFSFWMEDSLGDVRRVSYHGPKPANFEEAVEVVLEGFAEGDGFTATHILVKCPSKYNDGREFADPSAHPEGVPMVPAGAPAAGR